MINFDSFYQITYNYANDVNPSNSQLVLTFLTRTCNFNVINTKVVQLALHMKVADTSRLGVLILCIKWGAQ